MVKAGVSCLVARASEHQQRESHTHTCTDKSHDVFPAADGAWISMQGHEALLLAWSTDPLVIAFAQTDERFHELCSLFSSNKSRIINQ